MVQLPQSFNPNAAGQDGVGDFSIIPAGNYVAQMVESEMIENGETAKDPNGYNLKITWMILQGDYKDRKLWSRLNLVNINDTAVLIANKHLKSICDAVKVPGPISDTNVLHGIPLIIVVSIKAKTATKPEANEINNYKKFDGTAPVAASSTQTSNLPPSGGSGLPWESKDEASNPPDNAASEEATSEQAATHDTKPPWLK